MTGKSDSRIWYLKRTIFKKYTLHTSISSNQYLPVSFRSNINIKVHFLIPINELLSIQLGFER